MDPQQQIMFQQERRRNNGVEFDFTLGLIYRGQVRRFLDKGVASDGLFYVEVRDWGLSRFYVTGPRESVERYGARVAGWVAQVKGQDRAEKIAESKKRMAKIQKQRRRQNMLRRLIGLRAR